MHEINIRVYVLQINKNYVKKKKKTKPEVLYKLGVKRTVSILKIIIRCRTLKKKKYINIFYLYCLLL